MTRRRLIVDLFCGADVGGRVCGLLQADTDSGKVCAAGHGGAESLSQQDLGYRRVKEKARVLSGIEKQGELPVAKANIDSVARLKSREGDVLTVTYAGAKLAIGNYSNVDVDGATYQRVMRDGEDVEEMHRSIYETIKDICVKEARDKIKFYTHEVSKGRRS